MKALRMRYLRLLVIFTIFFSMSPAHAIPTSRELAVCLCRLVRNACSRSPQDFSNRGLLRYYKSHYLILVTPEKVTLLISGENNKTSTQAWDRAKGILKYSTLYIREALDEFISESTRERSGVIRIGLPIEASYTATLDRGGHNFGQILAALGKDQKLPPGMRQLQTRAQKELEGAWVAATEHLIGGEGIIRFNSIDDLVKYADFWEGLEDHILRDDTPKIVVEITSTNPGFFMWLEQKMIKDKLLKKKR